MIAEALGTPLVGWQRQVADVATERRPDGSYEHQVIVVSVPRQSGKTTLLRALGVHRSLVLGRDVFMTAQTGKDARARWFDLVKILRTNPALKHVAKISLRAGAEHVSWLTNDHIFQAFAPTPESLHGYTPPLVLIDEAFAQEAERGELLMGAIGPAQFTITDRQIWLVSTMGTAASTFFHDWLARGVEGTPRVGVFWWGADDLQSPYDLDDIAAFHPAVGERLGGRLILPEHVLDQAEKHSSAEYERAYANRATLTSAHEIPAERWRAVVAHLDPPDDVQSVRLVYEVAHDRRSAAIAAGWINHDGLPVAKIVEARAGTDWLVDRVAGLDRAWRPAGIHAAGQGPALPITEELDRLGVHVDVLTERDTATATSWSLTAIDDHAAAFDPHPALEASVTGLVTRTAGDGLTFSRRHSVGDSSLGIAALFVAHQAHRHHDADGAPTIYFPGRTS